MKGLDIITLLNKGVSPYHTAALCSDTLESNGFVQLDMNQRWTLKRGNGYFVRCYDSMVLAFAIGENAKTDCGLRIAASHTDWPCFFIKPQGESVSGGCARLAVEPYGGMIHSTWLDRPLSAAGIVTVRSESAFAPKRVLVDFQKPVFTIPNLAIHLNRDVNKGVELNPAKDLLPICGTVGKDEKLEGFILKKLAQAAGVAEEDILDYDMCLYNAEQACDIGFEDEMLSSPRLDNLTSVYAVLSGLIDGGRNDGINVAVFFNHEEIGSDTKQGADSSVLAMLIEKLVLSLSDGRGHEREDYISLLTSGFLLSCDVAHAVHPNKTDTADDSCRCVMNGGVAIKMNYSQNYSTEAASLSVVEALCKKHSIPCQRYMNRADQRGGSTLAKYVAKQLGTRTVDIGVPILAMHSARELMGKRDMDAIIALVKAYYCE